MKKWKKILLIVCLAVLIVVIIWGGVIAVNTSFNNSDNLNEFLQSRFDKMDVAGMAVTIIDDDEMSLFYGYGKMDIEKDKDVTEDTIFMMASISKTVTGCAVMQLVEQELIDLDEDINEYLPIKIVNPSHPDKKITTRMLLTHTSSIVDNWDIYDSLYTISIGGGDPTISLEEFAIDYYITDGEYYDEKLNFAEQAPSEYYEYSNCGYALLGYMIEEVTGQLFNEYCNENIFMPLGMENTAWYISELDESMVAIPYNDGEALPHYSFATYPDGSLRTNAVDFSKFISMMINKGTYKEVKILDESTVDEMLLPQVPELFENQGLTWDLKSPEEFKVKCDEYIIGHSGGDSGVITYTYFNPRTKKGIILALNDNLDYIKLLNYTQTLKRLLEEIS